MKCFIFGGSGFLGKNLIEALIKNNNEVKSFDRNFPVFIDESNIDKGKLTTILGEFNSSTDFEELIKGQDVIFHLISATIPGSREDFYQFELTNNVLPTIRLIEACIKNNSRLVFISSGGTVYGKKEPYPIQENAETNPICHYGVQKLMIEKYIYLYSYSHDLNCKIIRLANPYGPYQIPNSGQGVLTTFVYNTIYNKKNIIMGDGNAVRDYIYIEDAIRGVLNIAGDNSSNIIFNLGSGVGINLNQLVKIIEKVIGKVCMVDYMNGRQVDVPYNVLNISRYIDVFQEKPSISIEDGIKKLEQFFVTNKGGNECANLFNT